LNLRLVPDPIEIDSRPCELCGLTIDRHRMIDDGEGPEFFCDDIEREIYLRAAELMRQWECADPRDRWKHTGEAPPPDSVRNGPAPEPARQSNRPAQSTIDAFLHLARHDRGRLAAWLANHPPDVRGKLFKLWESKS
jgi:hypothetical protein